VQSAAQPANMRPVPGWAAHRMPIPGLYQTGSTTHPGSLVISQRPTEFLYFRF